MKTFLISRRRATSLLTAAAALAVVAGAPGLVQQHGGTAHATAAEASLQSPLHASTTHLALPFEIPQLQLPAPKLSSEHDEGAEHSPLSSIGANPQHHAGAPVPQPFDVSYLTGYVSDVSSYQYGIYYEVVREFKDLRSNHPEVMQKNLNIVAEYNNNAHQQRVDKAIRDALADKDGVLFTAAEALGDEFGRHFLAALQEKRLPKTEFLLGNGYAARAGGLASWGRAEKLLFNNDRPFVQAPERIKRYESPERALYDGSSKSFPSGHTNQATWITTLLAMMLPEVGTQLLARGSEAGESRLVMGVHFPLDVIGGRMTGQAAAADRWNDPKMRDALLQAREEIVAEMEWRAGKPFAEMIAEDSHALSDQQAEADYTRRMTYGFEPIFVTDEPVNVPTAAPALLETRFPELSYEQRAEVLRHTALPSGYPLDDRDPAKGDWQRINLARAWNAQVSIDAGGEVVVK
ncbi:phosphatase PAP2 family protein [Corynebacterium propinquum]|uniref:acid phosphatase n=1 Tax=Corynebacterium propinquum TaxID=43769 RepID=UPI00266E9D31|nr:phosphatase PAP2 family protein [Corynebacterium propinquum]WKS34755.1 phosphatase PAP2 family protein [Corynebacterium propinquum]WKS41236.1 phosphatase PAP2 family protein [Corynebacterium propinquum]